ncbi:MAG: Fic family protein [Pseudomonadota bacterium]
MSGTKFEWPDLRGLMDDFSEYFEEIGQSLQIANEDDLEAGFDRARNALNYIPDADAAHMAALIFDGVVTRHPLIDGNKRLAWQGMTTFLDLNSIWFDASELEAAEIALAVVAGKAEAEDLAQFIRENTSVWSPEDPA